jgi:hypothetical protein
MVFASVWRMLHCGSNPPIRLAGSWASCVYIAKARPGRELLCLESAQTGLSRTTKIFHGHGHGINTRDLLRSKKGIPKAKSEY